MYNESVKLLSEEIFEEIYGAQRVEACDKPVTESFLGFGIALTGSSCSLLQKMDAAARAEVLSKAFGKEGLNLSLARISVGSSDYSPEFLQHSNHARW